MNASNLTISTFAALLLALALPAAAQEFSYDGNRWFEVELIVFTNEGILPDSELAIPERVEPSYPRRLRELGRIREAYQVNFDVLDALLEPAPAVVSGGQAPGASSEAAPEPAETYGPAYSPAAPQPWRLPDLRRDPFLALPPEQRQLEEVERRLASAPGHRILYHGAWRQPALSPSQGEAVFVRGGDRYGEHNELEGSVQLSYTGGRVDLAVNLWYVRFMAATFLESVLQRWELPAQPFPPEQEAQSPPPASSAASPRGGAAARFPARGQVYRVSEVAQLRQVRSPEPGTLQYYDHPDFGVIVQVRPYTLPLPQSSE